MGTGVYACIVCGSKHDGVHGCSVLSMGGGPIHPTLILRFHNIFTFGCFWKGGMGVVSLGADDAIGLM